MFHKSLLFDLDEKSEVLDDRNSIIQGILSSIGWLAPGKRISIEIKNLPMILPVRVKGSLVGLGFCSDDPIEVFILGLDTKETLTPDGQ